MKKQTYSNNVNRSLSKTLQIVIPLVLGIFLIWYIYHSFTPEQLSATKNHFLKTNYSYIFLAILLNVLSHVLRANRWKFLLNPLGYHPKLPNSFMALSVGYLLNLVIPRSGEVSRAVLIDKYENIPFEKGFGTIISERIVDLIFLGLFTFLILTLEFDRLSEYFFENFSFSKLILLGGIGIMLIAGIILYIHFSKPESRIKSFLIGLKDGIFSILKMKNKTAFIFQTFLIWLSYVLAFYVALKAMPETTFLSFSTVLTGFVTGSFVLTFTHNGFGSYPFAMAAILSLFGIPKTIGVAFGWIVWISNLLTTIAVGVASLIILPFYNRKITSD